MISTALLFPSAANDFKANSTRNRTARDVLPDRFSSASARADKEEGSSIVIVNMVAKLSVSANFQKEKRNFCKLQPYFTENTKFKKPFDEIFRTCFYGPSIDPNINVLRPPHHVHSTRSSEKTI